MKKGAKRYAARIFEDGTSLAQSSGPRTPGTRVNELAIGRGLIEVRLE